LPITLLPATHRPPSARELSFGFLIAFIRYMYQVNLRMMVRPQSAVQAIRAMRSITVAAQVERGFVSSRIYQEVGNPQVLCLEHDWNSEPELKSHIRSSCFTDLLMLMETALEAPVLEVHSVSETRGLEYFEEVRFGDK
jgi:quinol monooxygenase YgiN